MCTIHSDTIHSSVASALRCTRIRIYIITGTRISATSGQLKVRDRPAEYCTLGQLRWPRIQKTKPVKSKRILHCSTTRMPGGTLLMLVCLTLHYVHNSSIIKQSINTKTKEKRLEHWTENSVIPELFLFSLNMISHGIL